MPNKNPKLSTPLLPTESDHSIEAHLDNVQDACPPIPSQFSTFNILIAGILTYFLVRSYPEFVLLATVVASISLPYVFRVNDTAEARRRAWKEWEATDAPIIWRNQPEDISLEENYWVNSRGMVMMTCVMYPKNQVVKGVICFCHGYAENCSFIKRIEYRKLVRAGFAIVGLEYEGHGRSDGDCGFVPNFYSVIQDTTDFFAEVCENHFICKNKPKFLMGESMGGAVSYLTYLASKERKLAEQYKGIVFVAPMCKIAEDTKPPKFVIDFLIMLLGKPGSFNQLGYLPVAPSADVAHLSFKVAKKRVFATNHPARYQRKPRLATARELLHITDVIPATFGQFDAPFLILHGLDDKVTDPKLSQTLYDQATSKDKTIKLYENMAHALTSGEPDVNAEKVFDDIIHWIGKRC